MPFKMFYYVDGLRYAMRNGKVYYQGVDEAPDCDGWYLSRCTQQTVYNMVANGTVTAVRNF